MIRAYYNEFDAKTAAWLRELIKAGLIMEGDVDERSICEVKSGDLRGYTRCHFFAGIGGWDYALQLAGWSPGQPVWTGSCPCQPFSAAGKRKGTEDERHLWPVWFRLIQECRPATVFGEQVASAVGPGWLDGVFADLEAAGYACGASVLGAHSVGAPHIRQRLYWLADSDRAGQREQRGAEPVDPEQQAAECGSAHGGMADDDRQRRNREPVCVCGGESLQAGAEAAWSRATSVPCRDGKHRRIPSEPAFFPLADGLPARVVRLRGYGNAIVPQVAAAFIEACRG